MYCMRDKHSNRTSSKTPLYFVTEHPLHTAYYNTNQHKECLFTDPPKVIAHLRGAGQDHLN
jgi:hypothetical protein